MYQSSNDTTDDLTRMEGLTTTERHRVLAAERRRVTLEALGGLSGEVALTDLARGVARREGGIDAADDEAVRHVKTTLHHVHLPMMDDVGVLTYEPRSRTVRPAGSPAES